MFKKRLFFKTRKPKGSTRKNKSSKTSRRRLQPVAGALAAAAAYKGYKTYSTYKAAKLRKAKAKAQSNFNLRLQTSDNVTSAPAFKIGTQRKIGFAEKVDRINNPPVIFKRQYAWSAECDSGRKGMFGIPINKLNTVGVTYGDLYSDAITGYSRLGTDTSTADPTLQSAGQASSAKVYVDYLSEKLRMVNSSSNSITGSLTLYAYKRDAEGTFTNQNAPMTPINLMMCASNDNRNAVAPLGYDDTVGNGWKFDNSTAGVNITSSYDMPGSSINSGGATAQVDPSLKVMSKHVKDFTGYYFREVKAFNFNLKPGQQINHYTIFNDLPDIVRGNQDMTYIKGVSYYIVVEFQAGIVGDSTAVTGNNVISTGSGQLSCILEEKRIIGVRGRNKNGRVYMPTPPLSGIAKANQYTINPDTGAADIGEDEDA